MSEDINLVAQPVHGIQLLEAIAKDLDTGGTPRVRSGGTVVPDPARWTVIDTGSGSVDECDAFERATPRPERSAAGSRQGTPREGSATGSRTAGATAQELGDARVAAVTIARLELAKRHYPQLQWRFALGAVWSHHWIRPVPGLAERALLITRHSVRTSHAQATWAWWDNGIWIGPRHTNMGPEIGGSVCAFDESDHIPKDDHALYLDLIALWTVRQLYFAIRGRWPGMQLLHTAYERLRYHGPGEFCGCASGRLYEDCCRPADLEMSEADRLQQFRRTWPRRERRIPENVLRFRAEIWT